MKHFKNFDLTTYNSFGLNSIANEIWFPETIDEITELVRELEGTKFEILSGGTNVLLHSKIDRVVCLKNMEKFNVLQDDNTCFFVSASYSLSRFVNDVIKNQLSGVEWLVGIPGLLGAGIIMNAGCGKQCISDYLIAVNTINLKGEHQRYYKKDLQFDRRYSILQDKKEIIVDALFEFKEVYPNQEVIKQVKEYRVGFPKGYSAGGIFINHYALRPYEKQIRQIQSDNLIVSKYLNVIINNGKATAKEILEFINEIRKIVKDSLKLEIKIMGEGNA